VLAESCYTGVYIQVSNFPFPWWDKTITIYNKFVDPTTQRISWYRTVVNNCFWKAQNLMFSMGRYGVSTIGVLTENKEIICRIPKDDRFLEKRYWNALEDKSEHFTLANEDIILLGDVDEEIDEYTPGKRSTDLLAKYSDYDEGLRINTYVNNVQTGVTLEHYRVLGN
jgi:hypothetical protein